MVRVRPGCLFPALVGICVPLTGKEVEHLKRIIVVLTGAALMIAMLVAAASPALSMGDEPIVYVPPPNIPGVVSPAAGTTYTCFASPFSWWPGTGGNNNTCGDAQVGPPSGFVCDMPTTFILFGNRVPAFRCHMPT